MSTARAVLTAIGTIAVLAIVAIPVFSMRLGIPDGSSEAPGTTEYQAYAAQSEHFGAGRNAPIVAVADIPADLSEQDLLTTTAQQAEEIAELDQVQHVVPVGENEAGDMLMFQIIPVHDANHEQTVNLVYELRGLEPAGRSPSWHWPDMPPASLMSPMPWPKSCRCTWASSWDYRC